MQWTNVTRREVNGKYSWYEYRSAPGVRETEFRGTERSTVLRTGANGHRTYSNTQLRHSLDTERWISFGEATKWPPTNIAHSGNMYELRTLSGLQAYKKLAKKVSAGKNELGMLFGQSHKTLAMGADISRRLIRSFRAFKRGDMEEAYSELAYEGWHRRFLTSKKYTRSVHAAVRADGVARNWLQYQYGIAPLASEVNELRQRMLEEEVRIRRTLKSKYFVGRNFDPTIDGIGREYLQTTATVLCRMQATVTITDKATFDLQKYGLENPWLVINDVIPWSFVLNWFTNHEQWLADHTAFEGVTIEKPTTSWKWKNSTIWLSTTRHHKMSLVTKDYFRQTSLYKPSLSEYAMGATGFDVLTRIANAFAVGVSALGGSIRKGDYTLNRQERLAAYRPRYVTWKLHKYHNHKI